MRAPILASIATLLLASASAHAGGIYQWKDAKGVSHYSDTPPSAGQGKQRNIYNEDPDVPADAAKAKPAENPACATARNNIALLNSKQNVQLDSNGDGKPDKALSDQDRANQLALAEATLKTSCASGDK
jgi:hypothetical protein